jgi:hypothetical protein
MSWSHGVKPMPVERAIAKAHPQSLSHAYEGALSKTRPRESPALKRGEGERHGFAVPRR